VLKQNLQRNSYARQIERLNLPYRFTTRELRDAIAALRGKPIILKTLNALGGVMAPCGVRVETPNADFIFYEENTSVHHQRHILTHELMHVYLDHPGSIEVDATTARAIGVSPALVRRMSGRTSYSSADEREAETLASAIRLRMYRENELPPARPLKGTQGWDALFVRPSKKARHRCW